MYFVFERDLLNLSETAFRIPMYYFGGKMALKPVYFIFERELLNLNETPPRVPVYYSI